ncbi:hypothetical protein [Cupriavidus metallidurans]|uniref:hypothetical protein n=1 Tax=Cupriavidus metallidurans TaxID=119219 RepID=UPI000492F497|nr:hypothetical protein [Cupriavidus metallidurans]
MAILSVPFELYVRWKLPPVRVVEEDLDDAEYLYQVYDHAGAKVCEVSTTMLRSDPRLFVRGILVASGRERQRFGTAAVYKIARMHRRCIVPVKETGPGISFWRKLRRWSGVSFQVMHQVSKDELRAIVAAASTTVAAS